MATRTGFAVVCTLCFCTTGGAQSPPIAMKWSSPTPGEYPKVIVETAGTFIAGSMKSLGQFEIRRYAPGGAEIMRVITPLGPNGDASVIDSQDGIGPGLVANETGMWLPSRHSILPSTETWKVHLLSLQGQILNTIPIGGFSGANVRVGGGVVLSDGTYACIVDVWVNDYVSTKYVMKFGPLGETSRQAIPSTRFENAKIFVDAQDRISVIYKRIGQDIPGQELRRALYTPTGQPIRDDKFYALLENPSRETVLPNGDVVYLTSLHLTKRVGFLKVDGSSTFSQSWDLYQDSLEMNSSYLAATPTGAVATSSNATDRSSEPVSYHAHVASYDHLGVQTRMWVSDHGWSGFRIYGFSEPSVGDVFYQMLLGDGSDALPPSPPAVAKHSLGSVEWIMPATLKPRGEIRDIRPLPGGDLVFVSSNWVPENNASDWEIEYWEQAPLARNDSFSLGKLGVFTARDFSTLHNDLRKDAGFASLVAAPTKGYFRLRPDGTMMYAPWFLSPTTDSFTYKVRKSKVESEVATVTFTTPQLPPGAVKSLNVSSTSIVGGRSISANVETTVAAASGGIGLMLLSFNEAALRAPDLLTLEEGKSKSSFIISTIPVATEVVCRLSAYRAGTRKDVYITVRPPQLDTLDLTATSLVGGMSTSGRVTLTGKAPKGGMAVSLKSSDPAVKVPLKVTVPEGFASARFTVKAAVVASPSTARVKAVLGTRTRYLDLTVTP